jgi:phenol 2-monooxygenase (NADPH)
VGYGAGNIVAKPGDSAEQGDGTDASVKNAKLRVMSTPSLASNIKIGQRMPSVKVLNQSDARPSHFRELLKANGRWRVVIFAGDVRDASQKAKLQSLGERMEAPTSFVRRFTPPEAKYDAVFEVMAVDAAPRTEATIFDFPEVFRPHDELDGCDYWKIFVDDESYHEGNSHAFEFYGIDAKKGCDVILRPDQHVSYVGPMDAYEDMDKFFSGFMLQPPPLQNGSGTGCRME